MLNSKPYHMTTVKIDPEMFILAKKYSIKISDACRAGISLLLAEKGVADYNNNLNIMRRLDKMSKLMNEKSQELDRLKMDAQDVREK